jgi:hypothetical protein
MDHRRSVTKTPSNVVWVCSCGWMTWVWRTPGALARNARLLRAWRAHIVKTQEDTRCS